MQRLQHVCLSGLKATVSTQANLTSLNSGGLKIGFGLEYDSPA